MAFTITPLSVSSYKPSLITVQKLHLSVFKGGLWGLFNSKIIKMIG